MFKNLCLTIFSSLSFFIFCSQAFAGDPVSPDLKTRGRYLVRIAGCNDCHTSDYAASEGKVPEKDWLKGDNVGWRGPWGTTYPINLRLYFANLSEPAWIQAAHTMHSRPPMPSYELNDMPLEDLRAIYAFIHGLGPAGEAMPTGLPPDQEPKTLYFNFTPVAPEGVQPPPSDH